MKLLLTSGGLRNTSIANALLELTGKPASETTLAFIPTAMNFEKGDKRWFINNLAEFSRQEYAVVDIVDISALPKSVWLPRLEVADILFFSGGNTAHLMHFVKESGLAALLPELLKTRVYAGISAGSIIAGPSIVLSSEDKRLYYDEVTGYDDEDALRFVDFHIRPHLGSPHFPNVNDAWLSEIAKSVKEPIYVLDDQSAVLVDGEEVRVITEGRYLTYNYP